MTVWYEDAVWRYSYFAPDGPTPDVGPFTGLVDLWRAKRGDRRAPAWADFDFFDFVGWHGYVSVYDVSYDPFDYTTRLSGTALDELFGRTLKGLDRDGFNSFYLRENRMDEFSEFCCRGLYGSYIEGPLNVQNREFIDVLYLELPLAADPEGGPAKQTIEVIIPADQRRRFPRGG